MDIYPKYVQVKWALHLMKASKIKTSVGERLEYRGFMFKQLNDYYRLSHR